MPESYYYNERNFTYILPFSMLQVIHPQRISMQKKVMPADHGKGNFFAFRSKILKQLLPENDVGIKVLLISL